MKPYTILKHTADLKIKIRGKTLAELFTNALSAMFLSVGPEIKTERPTSRKIKINSPDKESLLVDFLNEALYLSDVHNEAYLKAIFHKFTKRELTGKIIGRAIAGFDIEIKAVTHHGLKIKKVNNGWECTILFDI